LTLYRGDGLIAVGINLAYQETTVVSPVANSPRCPAIILIRSLHAGQT
jgi:hypothetical protein